MPFVPPGVEQSFHMFYIVLPSPAARTALVGHLRGAGIAAVTHYVPLHLSDMARQLGAATADCPVTESVSERLLRLPFHNHLTAAEIDRVIDVVTESDVVA